MLANIYTVSENEVTAQRAGDVVISGLLQVSSCGYFLSSCKVEHATLQNISDCASTASAELQVETQPAFLNHPTPVRVQKGTHQCAITSTNQYMHGKASPGSTWQTFWSNMVQRGSIEVPGHYEHKPIRAHKNPKLFGNLPYLCCLLAATRSVSICHTPETLSKSVERT